MGPFEGSFALFGHFFFKNQIYIGIRVIGRFGWFFFEKFESNIKGVKHGTLSLPLFFGLANVKVLAYLLKPKEMSFMRGPLKAPWQPYLGVMADARKSGAAAAAAGPSRNGLEGVDVVVVGLLLLDTAVVNAPGLGQVQRVVGGSRPPGCRL